MEQYPTTDSLFFKRFNDAGSEEPFNITVPVYGNPFRGGAGGQPGHSEDIPCNGDDKPGPRRYFEFADVDVEILRTPQFFLIVSQAFVCLCHTNGEFPVAQVFKTPQLSAGLIA